jgi:hypothetical protein
MILPPRRCEFLDCGPASASTVALVIVALSSTGCPGSRCEQDADCAGEVCTRTGECLAADFVREVQVRWTLRGAAPSAMTCAAFEPLGIEFRSTVEDKLTFSPLACAAGLFTVDKLPRRMTTALIFDSRPRRGFGGSASIPLSGQVTIDVQ